MSPVYDYECKDCGLIWESVNKIENRNSEKCKCGGRVKLLISTSAKPVIYEYYSEALDAHITGPNQRRKIMKEKGFADYDSKSK